MTPQNAASHLELFCSHREISSKNEIKIKDTPGVLKNESGLTQLIMTEESIRQIWVKCLIVNLLFPTSVLEWEFLSDCAISRSFPSFILLDGHAFPRVGFDNLRTRDNGQHCGFFTPEYRQWFV